MNRNVSTLPRSSFPDANDHGMRQHFLLGRGLIVGAQEVLVLYVIKGVIRILITVISIISIPPTLILLLLNNIVRTQCCGFMFDTLKIYIET